MRTSFLSISFRLAAAALTLGVAGMAEAADIQHPSASATAPGDSRQITPAAAANRTDWNIDYPSQLGPEGPQIGARLQRTNGDSAARQPTTR